MLTMTISGMRERERRYCGNIKFLLEFMPRILSLDLIGKINRLLIYYTSTTYCVVLFVLKRCWNYKILLVLSLNCQKADDTH